jgi:hypothetical protein
LTYDADVNAQRMTSQERLELVVGGKSMPLDTYLLHEIRSPGEILRFESLELLELDVPDLAPEKSANRIAEHVMSLDAAAEGSFVNSGTVT